MVFSTILFLFRFLPITLALYYLAPAKLKNTVLFVCSLVFYCWGEVRFFPVMLALILINYLCGLGLERMEDKPAARTALLLVALAGSLGMLFYFKYANFVLSSLNSLFGTQFAAIQGISTLPLGISFYTFQTLSYTIDVYRRDVKTEHNIIDFGAYVVMFPQLIAGPIVKYRDVSAQLHVYEHRYSLRQIEEGMTLFTFGLAKKVLLADAVGALWTDIIGIQNSPSTTYVGLGNASTALVWLGVIAYSLQLYFDFSGYSMMAIGMGKMLGFDFPQNFNYPYISRSITEFWRRWHMTLSGWFREYVYIPLGGNRKGLKRQIFNLFVVELLTGIWHGADWNFICWGLYYFILLAVEKLFLLKYLEKGKVWPHVYTLFLVVVGWAMFVGNDWGVGFNYLFYKLFVPADGVSPVYFLRNYGVLLAVSVVCCTPLIEKIWDLLKKRTATRVATVLVWLGVIAYSLQLYFDFSGYSMMAIGMGKMLGFDFPQNFNYPYISRSITEFWRRWHMTLSGWFREYVYIPLGGNRKGLKRQIFNLFVVELLTGIWHGADWNFICWGLYYFILLAVEKLFLLKYLEKGKVWPHVYTLFLVVVGWAMFVGNDWGVGFNYLFYKLFVPADGVSPVYFLRNYGVLLAVSVVCCTPLIEKVWDLLKKRTATRVATVLVLLVLSTAYVVGSTNSPFLYFNF